MKNWRYYSKHYWLQWLGQLNALLWQKKKILVRSQASPCGIWVAHTTLVQVFLRVLWFSPVSIIPTMCPWLYAIYLKPTQCTVSICERALKQNTSLSLSLCLSLYLSFSLRLPLYGEVRSNLRRLDRMLSGLQSRSGCEGEKYSAGPAWIWVTIFQSAANYYTDNHYRLAGLNNYSV